MGKSCFTVCWSDYNMSRLLKWFKSDWRVCCRLSSMINNWVEEPPDLPEKKTLQQQQERHNNKKITFWICVLCRRIMLFAWFSFAQHSYHTYRVIFFYSIHLDSTEPLRAHRKQKSHHRLFIVRSRRYAHYDQSQTNYLLYARYRVLWVGWEKFCFIFEILILYLNVFTKITKRNEKWYKNNEKTRILFSFIWLLNEKFNE